MMDSDSDEYEQVSKRSTTKPSSGYETLRLGDFKPPEASSDPAASEGQHKSKDSLHMKSSYREESWFVGQMDREQSEHILNDDGADGAFVIRETATDESILTGGLRLSVKFSTGVNHFRILATNDGEYNLGNRSFSSPDAAVKYYETHALFHDGDIPVVLQKPPDSLRRLDHIDSK